METTNLPVKTFPRKACEECGTEFDVKKGGARFCSDTCRSRAFRKGKRSVLQADEPSARPARNDAPTHSTQIVTSMAALPPHAQYIINQQEREITRWEKLYDEERTKRKALEEKNQTLKDQLKDMEHKQALNGIESAKPDLIDRLAGILQTLPPPVIEGIAMRFLNTGPGLPQLTGGTDGQLDADVQNKVIQFNQWFAGLAKPLQDGVYTLMVKLANAPSEEALQQTITKMQSVLKNGTTQSVPFTPFNH